LYKNYCEEEGLRPGNAKHTHAFIEKLDNGEIIICDVCGDYVNEDLAVRARYDHDKLICPDCRENGN